MLKVKYFFIIFFSTITTQDIETVTQSFLPLSNTICRSLISPSPHSLHLFCLFCLKTITKHYLKDFPPISCLVFDFVVIMAITIVTFGSFGLLFWKIEVQRNKCLICHFSLSEWKIVLVNLFVINNADGKFPNSYTPVL